MCFILKRKKQTKNQDNNKNSFLLQNKISRFSPDDVKPLTTTNCREFFIPPGDITHMEHDNKYKHAQHTEYNLIIAIK